MSQPSGHVRLLPYFSCFTTLRRHRSWAVVRRSWAKHTCGSGLSVAPGLCSARSPGLLAWAALPALLCFVKVLPPFNMHIPSFVSFFKLWQNRHRRFPILIIFKSSLHNSLCSQPQNVSSSQTELPVDSVAPIHLTGPSDHLSGCHYFRDQGFKWNLTSVLSLPGHITQHSVPASLGCPRMTSYVSIFFFILKKIVYLCKCHILRFYSSIDEHLLLLPFGYCG